jgi:anti-sigma factor RsiW
MSEQIDCKSYRPLLEDFVDGEVEPGQLGNLQEHLRDCPECFARVEFMRRLQGVVRQAVPPETTPELLRRRIEKSFKVNPWQRRMSQPWVRPALAAACLLILLAGLFALFPRESGASPWAVAMVNDHTMCWMMGCEQANPSGFEKKIAGFLGTKPDVPTLQQSQRLDVKPCPVKGSVASAHVFYLRPGKVQLSMYFAKQDEWTGQLPDSPQQARLDAVEIDGKTYQVASWRRKGMVTGLVADISREEMKALSGATKYDAKGQAVIPGAVLVASVSSP